MIKFKKTSVIKKVLFISFCCVIICFGLHLWINGPLMYQNFMITPKKVISQEEIKAHLLITKEFTPEIVSAYVIDNIDLFSRIKSVVLQYSSLKESGKLYYIDKKVIFTSGLYSTDIVTKKFEKTQYNTIMDHQEWKDMFEKFYEDGMAPSINKMRIEWDSYSEYNTPQISIYFYDDNIMSTGISCELGIMDEVDENTNPNEVFRGWIPDTNWRFFESMRIP